MSEESRTGPDWRKRFHAWWEGYVLPEKKPEAEPEAPSKAAAPARALSAEEQKANTSRFGKPLWTANRIEVAEKIWGKGFATPGGDDFLPYLLKPLGLNPKMSVLDLSAGLGGATRLMAKTYGCWVTGLESSPVLAEAAQLRSVAAGLAKQAPITRYDPETPKLSKRFDCVFSKEFLVFVKNREGITDAIEAAMKPGGQLLFTDYVLETPGVGGAPLKSWVDHEPMTPYPKTVAEVVNSLQQRNLDIRITEDITDKHRHLVITAIQTLTGFLEKHALDHETKVAVMDEVELWARRVAALQDGLRCYRFFALKFNDGAGT
ncbi:SAM-dependent methyltransferase [Arenibaculum pallidiluteum]|uniref:SAM-dependent methyltransferase n=1 Tax=Arenibaculum pallidiluteum TaxID=2812559 RepID=UPI001A9741DD|nr:methyltransferase domain-containing protein [Arenibaculum pallidiluteum]